MLRGRRGALCGRRRGQQQSVTGVSSALWGNMVTQRKLDLLRQFNNRIIHSCDKDVNQKHKENSLILQMMTLYFEM